MKYVLMILTILVYVSSYAKEGKWVKQGNKYISRNSNKSRTFCNTFPSADVPVGPVVGQRQAKMNLKLKSALSGELIATCEVKQNVDVHDVRGLEEYCVEGTSLGCTLTVGDFNIPVTIEHHAYIHTDKETNHDVLSLDAYRFTDLDVYQGWLASSSINSDYLSVGNIILEQFSSYFVSMELSTDAVSKK